MPFLPDIDAPLLLLIAVISIAGVAKGMSGFGTGMIVAPVAGALFGPPAAVAIIVIIDSLPTIPIAIPAIRTAQWSEVLPVLAGLFVFFPVGVWFLTNGDPFVLRWVISLTILACVVMLWSGWRYHGPRGLPVSLSAGGVAGMLSGIASIPGPPVIVYWIASGLSAAQVRANLITLFFLSTFVSVANLWYAGLFTREVLSIGLVASPFYFAGILLGRQLFGLASDATYRRVTFGLIIMAAILSLPLLDRAFGGLGGMAG